MSKIYTLSEVQINNGRDGKPCWIIIKESIYDITKFLKEHPGGKEILLEYGGKNATKEFNSVGHSTEAIADMEKYKIGILSNEIKTVVNVNGKLQQSVQIRRKRLNLLFCC